MDKYRLSVLITNYNTIDYLGLSLYALKKLTKNPYRVLINDNGSREEEVQELKRLAAGEENIFVNYRVSHQPASYAHAEALNILIGMSDTPYTAILDSDCTPLLKNWDEVMIRKLNDKVKIVGTPQTKKRSGPKPDNFPFQFAVLFETKIYQGLQIDCLPRDIARGEDTCWQWQPKFLGQGYAGSTFEARCTRDFKDTPFGDTICVVYYTDEGKIIASHFGRGSSGASFKYYDKWFYRLPVLGAQIKQAIADSQKKRWLAVCRRLINEAGVIDAINQENS